MRKVLYGVLYPLDHLIARVDNYIVSKLREPAARRVLTGICLTYASAGVWLIWEAWLTREVDDLVFGVFHTCVGVVYATILAMRTSIPNRIDYIAIRALREQANRDSKRLEIEMSDRHTHPLWDEKEEIVERYIERAASALQDNGRIPLYDGATEDVRYEDIINTVAEDLYDDDKYSQNA